MKPNHYETVFILTPVLSDAQMKDAVEKFKQVLTSLGADVYHHEDWGLKKLAYPIQHKSTGFYTLFEYAGQPDIVKTLETEFRRDERVMRFLTTKLDKHALEYNEKRRKGAFNKKSEPAKTETEA
ncbi:30S ribosomal protein S6 [Rhodoflexus sp.]